MNKRKYNPAKQNVVLASIINDLDKNIQQELVVKMLIALYNEQLDFEIVYRESLVNNKSGFSKADAKAGSELIEAYLDGKDISVQLQEWIAVKPNGSSRISKYWKQLQDISL